MEESTNLSQVNVEKLRKIIQLDVIQEAKIILIAMILNKKTRVFLKNLAEMCNAPMCDIDFGRTALASDKINVSKSFDYIEIKGEFAYEPDPSADVQTARENGATVQGGSAPSDSEG